MTITRVGFAHIAGWKTHWGRDPCAGERSDGGVRDLYREYAGGGGVKNSSPGEVFRESQFDKLEFSN